MKFEVPAGFARFVSEMASVCGTRVSVTVGNIAGDFTGVKQDDGLWREEKSSRTECPSSVMFRAANLDFCSTS